MSASRKPSLGSHPPRSWRRIYGGLSRRLRGRGDSECEQAIIRILVGGLAILYLLTADRVGSDSPAFFILAGMAIIFALVSVGLLVAVLKDFGPVPVRRILGILLDLSVTSVAMGFAGEAGAPLLAIYLWVIVGNGFRYGTQYLGIAAVVSLIGFAGVALYSPFWRQHPLFSASFMLILLVIPAYVAALLAKLRRAIRAANEASRAKSQFLANMSHELRTPLNGVIGMSDLLMDAKLEQQERELASTIQTSANTLLGIINNVLDFSRIEAGRLPIESVDFDLHRLVAETLAMFAPQAQRKGIALTRLIDPDTPYSLRGDALHIRQILMNLLGNAVKFTETGRVELRVSTVAGTALADELRLRFEIEDTGIGMSAEQQSRIFESFQQADSSTTRRFGGTGLGTTIARELVLLLGGDIGLRSEPGRGTLFWLELPLGVVRIDAKQARGALAGERALLVCGARAATQLSEGLAPLGLRTDVVALPLLAQALARASDHREPYDILLLCEQDLPPEALAAAAADFDDGDGCLRFLIRTTPSGTAPLALPRGFTGVLPWPLRREALLNAVHAARCLGAAPENVVSIADHYRRIAPAAGSRLHVLVAEDNETNRLVLRAILERAGHAVTLVEHGEAALDAIQDQGDGFDLLVLDKNMPERCGLDVFRAMRFMRPNAPIPTIILSADATPEALAEGREAGVDAYLTKPVQSRRLLETIARLVAGAAQSEVEPPADAAGDMLVDDEKLDSLRRLGDGGPFFDELVAGFRRDSARTLDAIAAALSAADYPALRAAIHALDGSAREIGAVGLAAAVGRLRGLKPFELGSARARELLEQLRRTLGATSKLLCASARDLRGNRVS
ncbi:ATP-binding protein [Thiocystis violacea]|uniref:ATP-binding protein n=1 Tax=Thiocystis violacea TaxID=13725 RepID=UPI0019041D7D|nr:ATP-binding protein [Thiocystis violacea]MBK1725110.1 hypothetical protein [Thiocystis violacea]